MTHEALNDSELEHLDTFLMGPTTPDETMDLEMVDGFFVALAIGPEEISEEEWLPQLFAGQTPEFSDQKEADDVLGLIRRHYETVQQAFAPKRRSNVGEEPLYLPVILEDEGVDEKWKETLGAYWASGFRVGILAREDLWQAALDEDEEFFDTVAKILALEGSDPDVEEDLEVLDVAQREERLAELPWRIEDLMFYWLEKRFGKVETVRHEEPKVGRNDPCPCGSGKKFKKCHGA